MRVKSLVDGMTVRKFYRLGKGRNKVELTTGNISGIHDERMKAKVYRATVTHSVYVEVKTKNLFQCRCCGANKTFYIDGVMN